MEADCSEYLTIPPGISNVAFKIEQKIRYRSVSVHLLCTAINFGSNAMVDIDLFYTQSNIQHFQRSNN